MAERIQAITSRDQRIDGHEPRPTDFATIGGDMFIEISGRFPATVGCQASALALECKKKSLFPVLLGRAILRDFDQLKRIQTATNNAHDKQNRKAEEAAAEGTEARYIPPIEIEGKNGVRELVEEDFTLAQRMMILTEAEIESFLTNPPKGKSRLAEDRALRADIENTLIVKRAYLSSSYK